MYFNGFAVAAVFFLMAHGAFLLGHKEVAARVTLVFATLSALAALFTRPS